MRERMMKDLREINGNKGVDQERMITINREIGEEKITTDQEIVSIPEIDIIMHKSQEIMIESMMKETEKRQREENKETDLDQIQLILIIHLVPQNHRLLSYLSEVK